MTEDQWLACSDPVRMVEYLRGSPTSEDAVSWWNNGWQLDARPVGADRKFRLFACACCRRVWDHLPEQVNRDAVVAVEDFLEGHKPGSAVEAALRASSAVEWLSDGSDRRPEPGYWIVKTLGRGFYKLTAAASALIVAANVVCMTDELYGQEVGLEFGRCFYEGAGVFLRRFDWPSPIPAAVESELATLSAILRCIFRNPFRPPPAVAPAWLTWNAGTVARLAQAIYDERELPSGHLDRKKLAVLADALEEAGATDQELLGHLREQERIHVRGCWVIDLLLHKEVSV